MNDDDATIIPKAEDISVGASPGESATLTASPVDQVDGSVKEEEEPQVALTFLISGESRTFSFEPSTTVKRVKEMVWSAWSSEWQVNPSLARPHAPSFLRILHLDRILLDHEPISALVPKKDDYKVTSDDALTLATYDDLVFPEDSDDTPDEELEETEVEDDDVNTTRQRGKTQSEPILHRTPREIIPSPRKRKATTRPDYLSDDGGDLYDDLDTDTGITGGRRKKRSKAGTNGSSGRGRKSAVTGGGPTSAGAGNAAVSGCEGLKPWWCPYVFPGTNQICNKRVARTFDSPRHTAIHIAKELQQLSNGEFPLELLPLAREKVAIQKLDGARLKEEFEHWCDVCGEGFSRKDSLKRHVETFRGRCRLRKGRGKVPDLVGVGPPMSIGGVTGPRGMIHATKAEIEVESEDDQLAEEWGE